MGELTGNPEISKPWNVRQIRALWKEEPGLEVMPNLTDLAAMNCCLTRACKIIRNASYTAV